MTKEKENLENKSDTEKPEGTGKSDQGIRKTWKTKVIRKSLKVQEKVSKNKENLENKSDTEKPEGTGKSEQE